MALATTSFPVPVSPWIRTAESTGATLSTSVRTVRNFGLDPIKSKIAIVFSLVGLCQITFFCPPPVTTAPPVPYLAVVDPNHVLPRTYEWNAAVEKAMGRTDVLTVTYLGAAGRKLMRLDSYDAPNPNFTGEFDVMRNDAD